MSGNADFLTEQIYIKSHIGMLLHRLVFLPKFFDVGFCYLFNQLVIHRSSADAAVQLLTLQFRTS